MTSGTGSGDGAAPSARRGRPGHSLESLQAVAVQLFIERGYEAASMEELAGRLGVTKAAIYHHVPGKEEFLRRALERALGALFAVTSEPAATTGRAIDRLEHVVRGSVRVLAAELPAVTLLLRVRGNTEVERAALQRRRDFDRLVAGLVREGVAQGDVRADVEPAVVARLLFGAVNSLTEWYRPGGSLSPEEVAEVVVSTAFGGLRTRQS